MMHEKYSEQCRAEPWSAATAVERTCHRVWNANAPKRPLEMESVASGVHQVHMQEITMMTMWTMWMMMMMMSMGNQMSANMSLLP